MSIGRCLVIVNPQAQHGVTNELLPAVRELLENVVEHDIVLSKAPMHAMELARDSNGYDTIIAVGGDGTVHEIANGIMLRDETDRPALTLIPTGSGNDYRRTLGISTDLATSIRQIASGVPRVMDVGVSNGTYFTNSMAVGMDARVTAKAVELKVTTGWSGQLLYLRAVFYVLFNQFYSHPVRMQFDDDEPIDTDMMLIALTNGPTYGGGFCVPPDAIGDDGLLDTCQLDPVSLLRAFYLLPLLMLGKHTNKRSITMSRHRRLRIWSEHAIEGQIDGEVMLETHYDISILPKALTTIVPRS